MKAIVEDKYGSADVLEFRDVENDRPATQMRIMAPLLCRR
jgi:hypothetical protein